MKTVIILAILYVTTFVSAAPTNDDEKLHIDDSFFLEELVIYRADHEIISLFVPLNDLNLDGEDESENATLFFALADEDENGHTTDKGLYILKEGQVTKLLDNGRDTSADSDDSKLAYFAAKDGIYSYDDENVKALKYGNLTDDIIRIAKANATDIFYIITADHKVYKVTEEGTKKSEILLNDRFIDLALDFTNNLYLLTEKFELVTIDGEGNQKLIDIPSDGKPKKLIRPASVLENSIFCLVDKNLFVVYSNGTYEDSEFVIEVKPSAYGPDATLIQFYAYNKKIYQYNILEILVQGVIENLASILEDKKTEIEELSKQHGNIKV